MSLNAPQPLEGKTNPPADTVTHVLTIDSNVKFATLQISATNDSDSSEAEISVYVSEATSAANLQRVDLIEAKDVIKPRGRYTNYGVLVPGNRRVYVKASTNNVIFRATALAHVN